MSSLLASTAPLASSKYAIVSTASEVQVVPVGPSSVEIVTLPIFPDGMLNAKTSMSVAGLTNAFTRPLALIENVAFAVASVSFGSTSQPFSRRQKAEQQSPGV